MKIYALIRKNHYDHLSDKFHACSEPLVAVNADSLEEAAKKLGVTKIEPILFMRTAYLKTHGFMEGSYSGISIQPPNEPPAWLQPQYPLEARVEYWETLLKPPHVPHDKLKWYIVELRGQIG